MVQVMASLIVYGDITLAQVPMKSQAAVKARLSELGYDESGETLSTV